jgi:hypothetical protein
VRVRNPEAFQRLGDQVLDLTPELRSHGALQVYLQAFSGADVNHDVAGFQRSGNCILYSHNELSM